MLPAKIVNERAYYSKKLDAIIIATSALSFFAVGFFVLEMDSSDQHCIAALTWPEKAEELELIFLGEL